MRIQKLIQAPINICLSAFKSLGLKYARSEITPFQLKQEKKEGKGFYYKGNKYVHHSLLDPKHTAFHRLNETQICILLAIIISFILGLLISWHLTLVLFVGALTFFYFTDLLFNLYLIIRSFSKPVEIKITDEEIKTREDKKWPTYTILCPLYREWQVLPQFITSMSRFDYPKDKLQVILILEEDDRETIQKVKELNIPDYFDIVIVPHSFPKTKPKACNYGLKYATGEYVVIYDAEDVPDPLQLKKVILAFERSDEKTICVQARLNFYNPHQNILTRVFATEYSLWFDLILTGLQSIQAPIPLGGTSNHFRTKDLYKLKGWDSFNVTEDADLGIRLVKQGYTTAIIDSVTLEEANSSLPNWFSQRSRWIKGYIQTYLVHMRSLNKFIAQKRKFHLITFQLIIGGKILSIFINPLMWIITISYFLFRAHIGTFIESFYPTPIFYMGVFSFIFGNFLYVYYYMTGSKKHGHHELVKYAIFIPFYWLAMSIAAWIAVYELVATPHYWFKTKHGLHLNDNKTIANANKIIGKKSIEDNLIRIPIYENI
jgi:cellulose synthase/poly-beta-1,6-N-acetylglucosamine synthase-like glycosyltransferase